MNGYSILAPFYDTFTGNVDYSAVHRFYNAVFNRYNHKPAILLDLACGTGSLSFEFEKDGYEVIGIDASEDMLSVAMDKKFELNSDVMFINQSAENLDLYGTVNTVVCNLDAVNHFSPNAINNVFSRISLFIEPGGLFVFDINSKYKFEMLLSDRCYSCDADGAFCCFDGNFDGSKADLHMDIFSLTENGTYKRSEDNITEYYYTHEKIYDLLSNSAFELVDMYADYSLDKPNDMSQRIHYITRKMAK